MSLIDKALFKVFKVERTFSQMGEDKIISYLFNSMGKSKISYLDVGANHPQIYNNTYLFYQRGAKGVCVEPNPEMFNMIKQSRPKDKNLNIGLGVEGDVVADFYVMSTHTLSTFSKNEALALDAEGKHKIQSVLQLPLKTINNIIRENFDTTIDLVSIDVEGWNEEIIASFDFTKSRPICFCVETITFSENDTGKKLDKIFEVFEENNYSVYADTHLNTIFLDGNVLRSSVPENKFTPRV
jgi:FkbM family methyltransferase